MAGALVGAALAFMPGCVEENPATPTDQTIEVVSTTESSDIAGKILGSGSNTVVYLEQGRPVDSTTVDASDGYFSFTDIGPGTYRFRIVSDGLDEFAAIVKVEPGRAYEFGNVILVHTDDDTIPSVFDNTPEDNAEIIYTPPDKYNEGSARISLSVSFDRPMDRESVEDALTIEPEVDGGYFVWYQNTKSYGQAAGYDAGTRVEWAMDATNDMLAESYAVGASPPSYVPSAEITTYSIAKSFTYYFPKAGCFTDTTYVVKISTDAVDTAGTPLDSAFEITFKTVQSAVAYGDIQMTPHDRDDWVSPLAPNGIKLVFPRRMNENSVSNNTTVNLVDDPIFLWHDYNEVTIYTGGQFVPETTYVVTIGADAEDLGGEPLGEDKVLSFSTEPIRVKSTSPVRGALGVNVDINIILAFNTNVDRTTFGSRCALVSRDGDTASCTYNNDFRCVNTYCRDTLYYLDKIRVDPVSDLKRNTLYTLYMESGAEDLLGYPCKTDYTLEFVTIP